MKKKKWFKGVVATLAMAMLVTGCGKKNETWVDGDTLAADLNNYVYKAESLGGIEASDDSNYLVSKDRIFAFTFDYNYEDEDGVEILPEARNQVDDLIVKEVEDAADESATETEKADSDKESDSTEDSANDTEVAEAPSVDTETTDASAEDAEEKKVVSDSNIDISDDGVIIDDPGFQDNSSSTMSVTYKCTDYDGKVIYEFTREYPTSYSIYNFKATENGELYYLIGAYDSNTGEDTYKLACLDSNGNEKWQTDLGKNNSSDNYYYPSSVLILSDEIVVVSTVGVESISFDGNSKGIKAVKGLDNIGSSFALKNDKIAATFYGENESDVYEIDVEAGKIGDKLNIPFPIYNYSIESGTLHDMLLSDSSGLYYYDLGDTEIHKIMDFVASDLCISSISYPFQKDEETVIGSYYDEFENKNVLSIFKKVDPEIVGNRKSISLGGMWIGSDIKKQVIDFNRSNEEYRIVLVDYSQKYSNMEWSETLKKINNDIITGKLPDIMICDNSLNVDNYVAKGVFAQLDTFIDNDPEIKREDYLENVLDALSYDGKLYYIASSFSIRTAIGKTSVVGDKNGWNMAEFVKFADSLPEGTSVYDIMNKDDFINNVMYYNSGEFIDKNTGKVSFDSQEFIDVLKFTDRLPKEIDYEKLDQDNYWNSYDTIFRDNRAAIQIASVYDLTEAYNNEITYFGEPVTYVGFPTASGSGQSIAFDNVIAINNKSKYKDAAWEFIRTKLLDEAQDNVSYTLPVKKSALEKKAAAVVSNYDKDQTLWVGGAEIKATPPTQADMDRIISVISSADMVANYSEDVINIIKEVTPAYYDGQKSAEEVAKTIQNRVQVYVNESR